MAWNSEIHTVIGRLHAGPGDNAMTFLLFPGRHLLHTTFQMDYLRQVLAAPLESLSFWRQPPAAAEPISQVIFAVTSANQENARYNPIPFYVRAIGVDRLAQTLLTPLGVSCRILGIPHYAPTPRFAEIVLKEIEQQTEGNLALTPQNCVVLSSTTEVIALFDRLGFAVLPAENAHPAQPYTPIQLLQRIVEKGEAWGEDAGICADLAPTTYQLWRDFPDVPRRIWRLWRDPLLNDAGSLTASRDYSSYAFLMGHSEIIALKYADIHAAILPGKIVDEGCGDGALLVPIARDFPDSDLIGIEITGEFLARARERQRAGEFGDAFVHFHQRNITQPLFQDGSIDTTICNSTVHELWSYGQQAETVHAYLALKYRQARTGGRLIIRDVVGPADKEQEVLLWLNDADGSNEAIFAHFDEPAALQLHLSRLSTYARFRRFARDFLAEMRADGRREMGTAIAYQEELIGGRRYAVLSLRDAAEFMSKKDYVNNWESELNEEFAFWDFGEWKGALRAAGFRVVEDPNDPERGSRVYTNPWIVQNRWEGKVALFRRRHDGLQPLPFPPTNIVLVGEKQ